MSYRMSKARKKEWIEGKRKGHKQSKETREKIKRNNNRYWLGKSRSEETKRKIGKIHKGKEISIGMRMKLSKFWKGKRSGESNPSWKGGITPENLKIRQGIEIRLWREAVYARDSWTCQKCGDNKSGKLNAHHIQNFANYLELRTSIKNGISFCQKCHKLFHKKYGNKNNTKKQLKEFLNL